MRRHCPILLIAVMALTCAFSSCRSQQPKTFVSELTSDDSLMIQMGQWTLLRYHSDKLGLDINYPSFLYHQDLPSETSQEIFISNDISLSVVIDSLNGMNHSAGQQMMGMGADLVEVGDNYSILEGSEDDWDYYGKVIDDDTVRIVTVMLRYAPNHEEAVEPLREWVNNFRLTP